MDLGEILSILRSRWYIVVPMLALAVGLGGATWSMVPTTYSTYTMVSLLSAPAATTAATQGQDNPFLNFNGSLVATADFLGRRLQSTDTVLALKDRGITEEYTVALAENAQGPFLTLTLTGDDRAHLLDSAAKLAEYADSTLLDIQVENGVNERDRIKLTQVIPPQKPETLTKEKLQPVIVVGGGVAALGLIIAFVVESVSRARKRRKALAAGSAPETTPATGSAAAPADIEGTVVIQVPPKAPHPAKGPAAPAQLPVPPQLPPSQPLPPPRQPFQASPPPAAPSGAEKTQRLVVPQQQGANPPLSRTYQSGVDRRGQDANRVNGS
ncbi:hypothetical protein [Actinoplanes utahensis]|uniref:Polysaccharide chain length determinant N-terminal domain-containing protein n=1 Tax=Actinoplanes utahensis TaxID=1869 RepID=A0A0A6UE76_ACTUT|nr:hypothetical protein [Actinoplanes utahensis]KHD73363.1 hypothetical protein MB27_34585 [Actinoplanes utahensis]GIF30111.1 hypothetical protein Aut01nite_30970 [Actinoplanes utahensis]